MKDDVRDALGKAAYEAMLAYRRKTYHAGDLPQWDALDEDDREENRYAAEAVVNKLAEMLLPVMVNTLLTASQIAAIVRRMA